MKVLYCRVSTLDQKTDRQKIKEKEFKLVIEDKCSGAVPFFARPGGMEIKNLIEQQVKFSLSVLTIDRLGRDLGDIINTIHFFTQNKTAIHFISQGLSRLDTKGKENPIAKMMISINRSLQNFKSVTLLLHEF
jgi:DNA invertase Pin-like site-specific DNA recombinase